MTRALFCKRGHPLTPENRAKWGECKTCKRIKNGRAPDPGVVYTMCRSGRHDLTDPAVARFNARGRWCGPCEDEAGSVAPARIRPVRLGPSKRYAPKPPRPAKPRLCRNGHDLRVVGLFGKKCNVCRVAPRWCKAGHLITGEATPGRSGCRRCDNLRKRGREHTKRARHYGSVVLNTKATGWRVLIDGQMCAYCVCQAATLDHVRPLKRGGAHADWNLVPACRGCNSSKGNRQLSEWRGRVCPGCGVLTGLLAEHALELTYSP